VQFEDDGLLPGDLRAAILAPGKSGFDDSALWDVARVVELPTIFAVRRGLTV
jgi:hypothetical protein